MDERLALFRLGVAKSAVIEARQRRLGSREAEQRRRALARARTRAWYAEQRRLAAEARLHRGAD